MRPKIFTSLLFCSILVVTQAKKHYYDQDTSVHTEDKKKVELGVSGLSASNEDNQADKKKGELGVSGISASNEANNQEKNALHLTLTEDLIKKFNIWPEAIIPFYIDEFSYDKVLRDRIRSYLDDVSALTEVLDFEELPNAIEDKNERWVLFVNRRGQLDCMDYTPNSFTNSGVQKVVIGYDCLNNRGDMAAMVLALAGVPPQHNAPNRDKFITVKDDNILPDKRQLFKRLSDGDWLFGTDYDPLSAGHYHSLKYTANGQPTIQRTVVAKAARTNGKPLESGLISEKNNFSSKDIGKIRALYYKIMRNNNNPLRGIQKEQCDTLYQLSSVHQKLNLIYNKTSKRKVVSPEPLSPLSDLTSFED